MESKLSPNQDITDNFKCNKDTYDTVEMKGSRLFDGKHMLR